MINEQLRESVILTQRLFNTEDGKAFLAVLEKYYCDPVFDPDPYTTAYRLGSHDLIKFIRRMVTYELERRPS
jgi:hypothetical protein